METVKKHKSKIYLSLFIVSALFLAFYVNTKVKPSLIEAACSDVAGRTSSIMNRGVDGFDDLYSYENIKDNCLRETAY
jgi:hypothetical protein